MDDPGVAYLVPVAHWFSAEERPVSLRQGAAYGKLLMSEPETSSELKNITDEVQFLLP